MTELVPVPVEQKETLRNLMEKYLCEFAQYDLHNVADEHTHGQFELFEGYPNPEVNYDDVTPADVFFFDHSL